MAIPAAERVSCYSVGGDRQAIHVYKRLIGGGTVHFLNSRSIKTGKQVATL